MLFVITASYKARPRAATAAWHPQGHRLLNLMDVRSSCLSELFSEHLLLVRDMLPRDAVQAPASAVPESCLWDKGCPPALLGCSGTVTQQVSSSPSPSLALCTTTAYFPTSFYPQKCRTGYARCSFSPPFPHSPCNLHSNLHSPSQCWLRCQDGLCSTQSQHAAWGWGHLGHEQGHRQDLTPKATGQQSKKLCKHRIPLSARTADASSPKNSEQKQGRGKGSSIPCRALIPNPSLLGSSPGLPFVPSRGCCHARDRHVPPAVPAAALHLFLADARVRIRAVSLQGGI